MPELPEVETVVRGLRPLVVGKRICGVWNEWQTQLVTPSLAEMRLRLQGVVILGLTRRGKYLLFELDSGDWLVVHLKMSGHLAVVDGLEQRHAHIRTLFYLENGQELRFRDQRKFGRVYLVSDVNEVVGRLGPEPLEPAFTVAVLAKRLRDRRRVLKPLLLDQSFVAGVGNIYADEGLFYAGIHPQRLSHQLNEQEISRLHAGIQHVLQLGIQRQGASIQLYAQPNGEKGSMQNEFQVYGRETQPCYRCGTPISRIRLGGRSTHFCLQCQQ